MKKYLDSHKVVNFHLIKKLSGMVLYIERIQTWLYDSPDYYVIKANDFDIVKLGLKSNFDVRFSTSGTLTGNFFFKNKFSGMVLYVEYYKTHITKSTRKATEQDVANLKLYI